MGANVSSTVQKSVTNLLQKIVNDSIAETTSDTSNSLINRSDVTINIGNSDGCNFVTENVIITNVQFALQNSSTLASNIASTLASDSQKEFERKLKQANSGLNLGQINVESLHQEFATLSQQVIQNTVENTIRNTLDLKAETETSYSLTLNSCKNSRFEHLNSINSTFVASVIQDAIVDAMIDNGISSKLTESATASTVQTNEGLSLGMFGVLILAALFVVYKFSQSKLALVLTGVALMGVGAYMIYAGTTDSQSTMQYVMIIGGAVAGVIGLGFLVYVLRQHFRSTPSSSLVQQINEK